MLTMNFKKIQNYHHPLQTRKTQSTLLTALACHSQNHNALHNKTLHVAVQQNTATVPLSRGEISSLSERCHPATALAHLITYAIVIL
jgi:hypothetical protein